MADAGLVGAAGGGGVAEPALDIDHDAVRGGGGLLHPGADLRLPAGTDLAPQPVGELRAGVLIWLFT